MAGGDAAVRGAAERGVDARMTGLGERGAHGVHTHVGDGRVLEPPERMDSDAGYVNAHVTTSVPSSSAGSTSLTRRIS